MIAQLVPPPTFTDVSFTTYRPDPAEPTQADAVASCAHFCQEALTRRAGKKKLFGRREVLPGVGLYLDGGFGVGKTHLLASTYFALAAADAGPAAFATFGELTQLAGVTAVGCEVLWPDAPLQRELAKKLPREVSARIHFAKAETLTTEPFDAVIYHGDSDQLRELCEQVAARDGAIVSVQGFARGESNLLLERLYIERSLSVNTAAAGGNASLMTIG